jgi:hypothetical protein
MEITMCITCENNYIIYELYPDNSIFTLCSDCVEKNNCSKATKETTKENK